MYLDGTTIYTILARSLNQCNSEMVTSSHNTIQVKWNIWLLYNLHSEGTETIAHTFQITLKIKIKHP